MEVINIAPEANPPQTEVLRIPFREHYGLTTFRLRTYLGKVWSLRRGCVICDR